MAINLLVQELKPKAYVVNFAKILKKLALVTLLIFLVGVTLLVGIITIFSQRTKTAFSNQESLKREIKALQETEQRIVLIKDRIDKVESVYKKENAGDGVSSLREIIRVIPEGVLIQAYNLEADNLEVTLAADSLSNLAKFVSGIINLESFEKIVLKSLEFDSTKGYVIKFDFNRTRV
ncbi:hypothetical protein A2865_00025 [Candidatus Woesebacteria bacterium RIFCSPHIGHO2_01_FULL_39_17]|uniref:Fimbrial assembly family protein n=3 Tax=Candidatus Woeseibacteriota TaxID=1752722 RepID=A0A0G0NN70_9BACT|nr:MAG: hypothetical protein US72_C0022G0016 [Microgenomates group bacterium GW2011_GWC1_38_12]KKQ93243.1 MAG: hypothetical protein UT19_C0015G0004 [Candidatus Woesebacteria bacterium GW2011_GWB1_39_10b]KKR14236.1 MAG: hypothetical protein UT40_C0004G0059 [Candidatus Woesebacteria bacterium GW2011_GWA1_39_21b]OGM23195.1 MAG: hypothetical protein A2865_00025 [Candidatus Woesebacteria bacterium RIFCSPHIGHO2_01_FULL_39_17]OGM61457.1 MAG: hypothetical protein A3A52_01415 [Candidatus Woesebacteria b